MSFIDKAQSINNLPKGTGSNVSFMDKVQQMEKPVGKREPTGGVGLLAKETKEGFGTRRERLFGSGDTARTRRKSGVQGVLETGVQHAGEILGGAFDLGIGAVKAITPNFIERRFKKNLSDMFPGWGDSPAKRILEAGIEKFEEQTPRTQANIRGVLEIASIMPVTYGAKAVAKSVIKGRKLTESAVKESRLIREADNLEKIVKKGESDIFAVESNYGPLRKANDFSPDGGLESRRRIASTDVLSDAVNKEGLIRTTNKGGAVDQYRAQSIDGGEGIVRASLINEGKTINIQEITNALNTRLERTILLEGRDLEVALGKIEKEIAGLSRRADELGNLPLEILHDAKISQTKQINFQTAPEKATTRKAFASVYKRLIEKKSDLPIEDMNKDLGKFYQDIKRLENLDGRKVKQGRLGKYFTTVTGNIVGAGLGSIAGVGGAGVGALAGGNIARRILGKKLSKTFGKDTGRTLPKSKVLEKAKEDLKAPQRNLKKADPKVGAPKDVPKTKEILKVEKEIADNVKAQKKAIAEKKPSSVVLKLKEAYDGLVIALKKLIQKVKDTPNKQGGFVKIGGGKKAKQIDEATKAELVEGIDYLRLDSKKGVNKKMEQIVNALSEKFDISPDLSSAKIADRFQDLIENTKTVEVQSGKDFIKNKK